MRVAPLIKGYRGDALCFYPIVCKTHPQWPALFLTDLKTHIPINNDRDSSSLPAATEDLLS